MNELKEEEKFREASLYAEMRDLRKIKKIFMIKFDTFNEKKFKLRRWVLGNLRRLIKMQLRALDEEYHIIGLDEEYWQDEEHLLYELSLQLRRNRERGISNERREYLIKKIMKIENVEERQTASVIHIGEEIIEILCEELKRIQLEHVIDLKILFAEEEKRIEKLGRIIKMEELEESLIERKYTW